MHYADPEMLKGQVAWVTASARGLGRAIAERLACCGASVAVHGRSEDTPREFDEALSTRHVADDIAKRAGNPVITVYGDLSDPQAVDAAVARIEDELGPIGLLVNNAGGDIAAAGGKPEGNDAYSFSPEDLHAVTDRNLTTTMLCCCRVVPGMVARGGGRIVNIGSVVSFEGTDEGVIYAAAKGRPDPLHPLPRQATAPQRHPAAPSARASSPPARPGRNSWTRWKRTPWCATPAPTRSPAPCSSSPRRSPTS